MKKKKSKERGICSLCSAKRFIEFLFCDDSIVPSVYVCKNEDLCVLKMSYNKKKKKICVKK